MADDVKKYVCMLVFGWTSEWSEDIIMCLPRVSN